MRTKSVLLGAALLAAGVATSMAQSNVYSLNVVGYVNTVLTGGSPSKFNLISNPLNSTNNTIGNLIPSAPNFANFYKYNGAGFDVATFFFGAWDHPEYTLKPGEGGFILTDTTFTNTFVGTVQQGSLTNHLNAGYTLVASQAPVSGNADSLGVTPAVANFDNILKWNFATQQYDTYTLFFGSWNPSVPTINVGESVFTLTAGQGNWVTNFTVQ